MCRIFYNPHERIAFQSDSLNKFFETLEKKQGGHGNGIYLLDTDESYKTMLDMEKCRLFGKKKVKGRFIFHTRLATHGEKKEYNVQPLVNCRYVIAHNGVFSMWNTIGKYYGVKDKFSDSHTILKLISEKGITAFYSGFMDKIYGVVLVYDKQTDMTYLLKTGGMFEMGTLKSGKYLYGSSNIEYWGVEKPERLGDGMYILKKYECIQIHKPEEYHYYYSQNQYNKYYGRDRTFPNSAYSFDDDDKGLEPDAIIMGKEFYGWEDSELDYINLDDLYVDEIEWDMSDYPCGYHPNCNNDCGNCDLIVDYYKEKQLTYGGYMKEKYKPDQAQFICGYHPKCNSDCDHCPLIDWGEEEIE